MKKQILMMIALLCMVAQGAWAISFITHEWDDTNKKITTSTEELNEGDYTALSGNHASDWLPLDADGKYVVTENASYKVLNIMGTNVHLYLCNGVTLNVKHIKLESGKSLHIHAQSMDDTNLGKLVVNNDEYSSAAGIGGGDEADAGDLYIHGGDISVTASNYAAGIGGGENGSGGNVVIYGGSVTSNGGAGAAGIGGGNNRGINYNCSVTIYDGTVKAYGNGNANPKVRSGAGIGGGNDAGQGGAINIYGGTVTAKSNYHEHGAAIGGGFKGDGGVVNIYGGTVYAYPSHGGSGIGRGQWSDTDNAKITITGGTIISDKVRGWGRCLSGNISLADGLKVYKGTDEASLSGTPVAYGSRRGTCIESLWESRSYKIEPCKNHNYVDYICSYCGKEYSETATGTWEEDGIRATTFSNIDENSKTITITKEAELGLLSYNISHNDGKAYEGWTINLGKDLDMRAHKWVATGNIFSGTFSGTFNGQGHTISGLFYSKDNKDDAGLFAHNGGTIKNIKLVNSVIVGNRYVGAIAGENTGTVENCYVGVDVSVFDSDNSDSNYKGCGGIVGIQTQRPLATDVTATTRGCYSVASVNAYNYAGGVIGYMEASTLLEDCVSKATINLKSADGNKGIIVGTAETEATLKNNGYISETIIDNANGIRLVNVSLSDNLKAEGHWLVNHESDAWSYDTSSIKFFSEPTALVDNEWYVLDGEYFTFSIKGSQPDYTYHYVTVNGTMLESSNEYTIDASDGAAKYIVDAAAWVGTGTQDDPWLIQNTNNWNSICNVLNNTTNLSADLFAGKYFKQTADIDITQGIGATGNPNNKKFCGTYDGDNHKLNCILSNPVENSYEAVAPFHNVNGATIKNLYVTGTISGGIHSAGLVAYSHGNVTIDNVRVAADITCTGSTYSDAHGGGFVGNAMASNLTIKKSLFDGKLTATPNGKGDIRLGAIVGWGGNTIDIQYSAENGTYEGTTDDSQTAFCWKAEDNTTPDNDYLNIYLSNLGHHDGADKVVKVISGTEGLELSYPDNCYDWKETYHGAMFRSSDEYAIAYLIHGQFYTINGCSIRFDATYPDDWNNVKLYNGETELTYKSGLYSFKLQSNEDVAITATYSFINWIDDGIAATSFSDIDEENKVVTITTPAELALLSKQLYSGTTTGEGWTYKLGADLDMSKYDWTPIGKITDVWDNNVAFAGTFDGQGHTISGIKVTTTGNYFGGSGLFCNVIGGEIIDVKLTNSQIEGYHYVGGISGYTNTKTTIKNCFVGSDVTLKASATQAECGGIVGAAYHSGLIQGCYSAAHISSSNNSEFSNVGGIVGYVIGYNMEVCDNVSQAVIVPGTSDEHTRGYVYGSQKDADISNNFYIAAEASNRRYDVRAFKVKLKRALAEEGFELSHTESDCQVFDVSKITKYPNQFTLNGEWYAVAGQPFSFTIPAVKGGATLDNVTANGNALQQDESGNYSFTASSEVVGETNEVLVSGSPLLTLSNTADNSALIEAFDGKKVNVKLADRTLYHDGKWNVICLPFNLSLTGSALETSTCKLKTLESTSFNTEKGTLTLNFTKDNLTQIEAGKPYIIMWAAGEEDTVNPVFCNVTISKATTDVVADKVTFTGSYMPVSLTAGDKTVLYMGGNNKLYYPTSAVTLGSCRAYFKLNGITASDIAQGAKAIVLNFGEEEVVTSIHNSQLTIDNEAGAWYSVAGRRLSGKPTQKGVYIYNGKKVVIK